MKKIIFMCFGLAILFASCSSDEGGVKTNTETETIETFLNAIAFSFSTTPEGVYQYGLITNPAGNNSGDIFSIYYTLTNLETGNVIESHLIEDGDPIKLKRNSSAIFPQGLDFGLAGIREGEIFGIVLPNSLGYGAFTTSGVPLGTILHFEVEVVLRENESGIAADEDTQINNYILANNLNNTTTNPLDPVRVLNNSVYYKRRQAGDGTALVSGDSITIDYNGTLLDDSSFDNLSGLKYQFGSGSVIPGLDTGIKEMEQGERATLFIPSAQAYGASVRVIPASAIDDLITQSVIPDYVARVKPYEVLVFDVTLQTIH